MLVRELKEFLKDKDDLSEIIVDTFEVQECRTSIFPITEIFEDKESSSTMHNDIIIVLKGIQYMQYLIIELDTGEICKVASISNEHVALGIIQVLNYMLINRLLDTSIREIRIETKGE